MTNDFFPVGAALKDRRDGELAYYLGEWDGDHWALGNIYGLTDFGHQSDWEMIEPPGPGIGRNGNPTVHLGVYPTIKISNRSDLERVRDEIKGCWVKVPNIEGLGIVARVWGGLLEIARYQDGKWVTKKYDVHNDPRDFEVFGYSVFRGEVSLPGFVNREELISRIANQAEVVKNYLGGDYLLGLVFENITSLNGKPRDVESLRKAKDFLDSAILLLERGD